MPLRPFKLQDFPAIMDIYAESKLDELQYDKSTFELLPLEEDEKRLAELLASDIYVYDDGGIIAYGALHGSEIRALFVHPDERGKGFGKRLLMFLLSKVPGSASLFVAKSNEPAKHLYTTFGFAVVDEFETTYNGVNVLANKMVRPGLTSQAS